MFKIGTHSGPFHADELLAIAAILLTPGITQPQIVRSWDPKVLADCDILVDVGGVYDVTDSRFDHHHDGNLDASNMLVWAEYGRDVCGSQKVADLVASDLMIPVSLGDTGKLNLMATETVTHHTVSHVLAGFNPNWNDAAQDFDAQFLVALEVAKVILNNSIARAKGLVEADTIADAAIAKASGGSIVELDKFAPIMSRLIDDAPDALFLVYPGAGGDTWMVQAIPPAHGSFQQRKPLLAAWAGKRDAELQAITGLDTAVFVHPGLFIGGCATKRDAMTMARMAIIDQVSLVPVTQ